MIQIMCRVIMVILLIMSFIGGVVDHGKLNTEPTNAYKNTLYLTILIGILIGGGFFS